MTWPFLLPLERAPHDPDVLISPLLDRAGDTDGPGPVHSTLLAFANAGMFTQEQSRRCAGIVADQASRAIDDLRRRLAEHGLAGRWDDDYVSSKIDAGLLLDLLGRLDQPSALPVFEAALSASDPGIMLWGALGLVRSGRSVAAEVFRRIAREADCRLSLARELGALDRSELFPADFLNQSSLAEAAMVEWLLFSTELGRAPDEIRQLEGGPTGDGRRCG